MADNRDKSAADNGRGAASVAGSCSASNKAVENLGDVGATKAWAVWSRRQTESAPRKKLERRNDRVIVVAEILVRRGLMGLLDGDDGNVADSRKNKVKESVMRQSIYDWMACGIAGTTGSRPSAGCKPERMNPYQLMAAATAYGKQRLIRCLPLNKVHSQNKLSQNQRIGLICFGFL